MAELDDLLTHVEDDGLRSQLKAGVDALSRQLRFGLVFERHLPEVIRAYKAPVTVDEIVEIRSEVNGDEYTVEKLTKTRADLVATATGERRSVAPREVVVVKRFGEPAYPALRPAGSIRRSLARMVPSAAGIPLPSSTANSSARRWWSSASARSS